MIIVLNLTVLGFGLFYVSFTPNTEALRRLQSLLYFDIDVSKVLYINY